MTTRIIKGVSFVFLLILLIGIFSFKSADTQSQLLPTRMKVTVLDELGNVVEGATVTLYTKESDYKESANAAATGTTNEKGEVKFKDLKPKPYFVDARKGDKNNDAAGVKTAALEEGKLNKVNIIIE